MHLHGECKGRSLAPMLRTTRTIRTLNALLLTLGARGVAAQAPALAPAPRLVTVADLFRLRDVADPQLSPDGAWVAYTVTGADSAEDKQPGAVWMTSWDGSRTLRLTNSKEGESAPRWSPDGRWLAFLSSRQDEHTQLWLLDRSGGEGRKLTSFGSDVEDYVWAPDGKRLAAVVGDADTAKPKTPAPVVIDRFQFKQDEIGYLSKERRHLYLVDVETGKGAVLTPGPYDELLPAWSPDGRSLVFVSKRRADFDRDNNWDLYLMDAVPGAVPRPLTTFGGPDNDPDTESRPAWSPDGRGRGGGGRGARAERARRGVRPGQRGKRAAPAVTSERRVAEGGQARTHGAHHLQEPRRHHRERPRREAAGLPGGNALPRDSPHPRRTGVAVSVRVQPSVPSARGPRLPRGRRESTRQLGTRRGIRDGHLRRLGEQGRAGRAGGGRLRHCPGAGRSGAARRGRVELRRGPHPPTGRPRPPPPSPPQRRPGPSHTLPGKPRSIHPPVLGEAGRPLEALGRLAEALIPVSARRPDRHAHPVPVRGQGFQRAATQLGADVSGAQEPRRGDRAGDLSGAAPRNREAQLPAGSHGAVSGVVRSAPQELSAPPRDGGAARLPPGTRLVMSSPRPDAGAVHGQLQRDGADQNTLRGGVRPRDRYPGAMHSARPDAGAVLRHGELAPAASHARTVEGHAHAARERALQALLGVPRRVGGRRRYPQG